MARIRKPHCALNSTGAVWSSFSRFCGLVGLPFGVKLPVPDRPGGGLDACLSFVKDFCGGLLDNRDDHLWRGPISRLSRDNRMSIAMSLFLFRKALPSSPPSIHSYLDKMSGPSPPCDEKFLAYCKTRIPQIFRPGWDAKLYPDACLSATLTVNSCVQSSKKRGGCRGYVLSSSHRWNDHVTYVIETLAKLDKVELLPSRVSAVETAGKHRVISSSDVEMNLVRPLHTAIYNHLSRFPWLLRGDAKASSFSEFQTREGEVFVSGDYESATDNLVSVVQESILREILNNSDSVPNGVKETALDTLHTSMVCGSTDCGCGGVKVYRQERGQLMGNLLSFPLLCIVNYLAFRFYSRSKAPVRVNGDDIVFRASPEESDRWMKGVVGSGLTLSRGKTMVHSRYFTLNSTLFIAGKVKARLVPFLRSTAFGFRPTRDSLSSLSGRYRSFCPGFFGVRRSLLRTEWLKWNSNLIVASSRSVTRGLGIPATFTELQGSGLWEREAFYLSLPKEQDLPVPVSRLEQLRIPDGFELRRVASVTKKMRRASRGLGPAFVQCAWSRTTLRREETPGDYYARVLSGTFSWEGFRSCRTSIARRAKLVGLSPRNFVRFVRPSRSVLDRLRLHYKQVWLPVGFQSTMESESSSQISGQSSSLANDCGPDRNSQGSRDSRDESKAPRFRPVVFHSAR